MVLVLCFVFFSFFLPILCLVNDFLFIFSGSRYNIRGRGILGIAHKNVGASKPEPTWTTTLHGELSRTWLQDSAHVQVSVILHKVIEWYFHLCGLVTTRDLSFKNKESVAAFLFLFRESLWWREPTCEKPMLSPFLKRRKDCILYFP